MRGRGCAVIQSLSPATASYHCGLLVDATPHRSCQPGACLPPLVLTVAPRPVTSSCRPPLGQETIELVRTKKQAAGDLMPYPI